jgi:hypothetical protein
MLGIDGILQAISDMNPETAGKTATSLGPAKSSLIDALQLGRKETGLIAGPSAGRFTLSGIVLFNRKNRYLQAINLVC